MEYNLKKIGERLKAERKNAGWKSQDKLSEVLEDHVGVYDRQRIGRWENGKELPPMEVLCTLCDFYDCDIGYLLCEYDCKTRPKTDIAAFTGLSESAIEKLSKISSFPDGKTEALNAIIEDNHFDHLLSYIAKYRKSLTDQSAALKEFNETVIQSLISDLSSGQYDQQHEIERTIADLRLQNADLSPEALEYQIDSCFQEVIHDIRDSE